MRRKCCHCLHIVERFSSWIRMKNSLPLTVLSRKNSAYKIRRKKPTKGPTKSLADITPINFVNVYLNLHSHWAAFTIHVLLLCQLRGKQLDKVRDKVLKMSHDKPSEESENVRVEQDTKYIIPKSVPSYGFFQRKK